MKIPLVTVLRDILYTNRRKTCMPTTVKYRTNATADLTEITEKKENKDDRMNRFKIFLHFTPKLYKSFPLGGLSGWVGPMPYEI